MSTNNEIIQRYADVYKQSLKKALELPQLNEEAITKLRINLGRSFIKQSQVNGADFSAVKIGDQIIKADGTVLQLQQAQEANIKFYDLG